jgi:hypothetical protein
MIRVDLTTSWLSEVGEFLVHRRLEDLLIRSAIGGWTVGTVEGPQGEFDWATLAQILAWIEDPATNPFDFQSFSSSVHSTSQGPTCLILGRFPNRWFFAIYTHGIYTGGEIDSLDAAVEELRALQDSSGMS